VALDNATFPKLGEQIEEHQEELSTTTLGHIRSHDEVTTLSKHLAILHSIIEEKTLPFAPLK
jgi:hypothetical protein